MMFCSCICERAHCCLSVGMGARVRESERQGALCNKHVPLYSVVRRIGTVICGSNVATEC